MLTLAAVHATPERCFGNLFRQFGWFLVVKTQKECLPIFREPYFNRFPWHDTKQGNPAAAMGFSPHTKKLDESSAIRVRPPGGLDFILVTHKP